MLNSLLVLIPLSLKLFASSLESSTGPIATRGCDYFQAQLGEPIKLQSRTISGEALGGTPQKAASAERGGYDIGVFQYYGGGREAFSTDPRFDGVLVSKDNGLHHRCGHRLEITYTTSDIRATQPALSQASFRFDRSSGVHVTYPGSTAASKAGAMPIVDGYAPGASWPIHTNGNVAYLGLMHPKDGRRETLLVRFEDPRNDAPTRILARLPALFQYINILPKLHQAGSTAFLFGKDPGGPYREIALEMADDPGAIAKSTVVCSTFPDVRSLQNLDCTEATALIEQLRGVQRRLRAGERLTFRLLSGAPASNPMSTVSPREAFLKMPFEGAFIVERVKTDNRLWRPYKLAIQPPNAGRFIWDVEVVRGFYGEFERVEMLYEPPPPF